MAESFPEEVFNHDILFLYDNISRFHVELAKSQSSPVSGMIEADQTRLLSYLSHLKKAVNWMQAMPALDLPESHPHPRPLEPFPADVNVENESINMLLRLIKIMAVELTNSQSARFASRLQPFDEQRLVGMITKVESFLVDFIRADGTVPLDVPESSPEEPMTTSGIQGL